MEIIEKLSECLHLVYSKELDSSMPFHDMVLLILLIAAICWILLIVSIIAFLFYLKAIYRKYSLLEYISFQTVLGERLD